MTGIPASSELSRRHLEEVGAFFDRTSTQLNWAARDYRELLARYYNLLIRPDASLLEIGCGAGDLLALLKARRKVGIDLSGTHIAAAQTRVPGAEFHLQAGETLQLEERFDYIIVS